VQHSFTVIAELYAVGLVHILPVTSVAMHEKLFHHSAVLSAVYSCQQCQAHIFTL